MAPPCSAWWNVPLATASRSEPRSHSSWVVCDGGGGLCAGVCASGKCGTCRSPPPRAATLDRTAPVVLCVCGGCVCLCYSMCVCVCMCVGRTWAAESRSAGSTPFPPHTQCLKFTHACVCNQRLTMTTMLKVGTSDSSPGSTRRKRGCPAPRPRHSAAAAAEALISAGHSGAWPRTVNDGSSGCNVCWSRNVCWSQS